jgi:hypothetical protein
MKATRIFLLAVLFAGRNVHAQKIYIRGGLGMAISTAVRSMTNITNYEE